MIYLDETGEVNARGRLRGLKGRQESPGPAARKEAPAREGK